MRFGEKLKGLREREDITQEQLAGEMGISANTIIGLEEGSLSPDVAVLLNISRKFGVTTDYLLKDEITYGRPEKTLDEEDSEKAGKRMLAFVMGAISLIILAFTPMFACSIQMKELATLGESLHRWEAYILKAPLIYIFLLAVAGIVSAIYLLIKNRKM